MFHLNSNKTNILYFISQTLYYLFVEKIILNIAASSNYGVKLNKGCKGNICGHL